jgi:hypothetical protein
VIDVIARSEATKQSLVFEWSEIAAHSTALRAGFLAMTTPINAEGRVQNRSFKSEVELEDRRNRVLSFRALFSVFALSSVISIAGASDALPSADEINALSRKAKQTTEAFLRESIRLRFQYEYSGQFLTDNDRGKLGALAGRASQQLQEICESQQNLKGRIEEYEGDDWDDRYGSTGLWRRLFADLYVTNLDRCEIDFYVVPCAGQEAQGEMLRQVLARIDSLGENYITAYLQLLRARALVLLSRTDPTYKSQALREFDLLAERSDMSHSTVFKIAIERIKLLGPGQGEQLSRLTDELVQSTDVNDFEVVLFLACLQRRLGRAEAFEKTVGAWPQIETILGSLALADLSYSLEHGQLDLQKVTVLEAELAAQAAWRDGPEAHAKLLRRLASDDKFQSPLVVYVTALACVQVSPGEAGNLLIRAAGLQQENKSGRLDIEAEKIAEQAARLQHKVRLDLVRNKLIDDYYGQRRNKSEMAKELLDLLRDCTTESGPDSVRSEALRLYCQLLLDSQDPNEAQEVLNILTDGEVTNDPNLNVFKSSALRCAGKLDEAAECLAMICGTDNRERAIEAEKLLGDIIDQIEQLEHDCADFQKLLNSSLAIARYCERISLSADGLIPVERARLYLAEILLFSASGDPQKVSQVEKTLAGLPNDGKGEDVDFLRCRARLLTAQGKFKEAGALWASIAKICRGRSSSPGQRSYQWWRAKFYELYCLSKTPQSRSDEVLHAIEVLENSFAEVPPLWAGKLSSLKEQCR